LPRPCRCEQSQTKIGAKGADALMKALEANRHLETLNLGWNKLPTDAFRAFTAALERNATLTNLNLIGAYPAQRSSTL
jgi:hypothetical protein